MLSTLYKLTPALLAIGLASCTSSPDGPPGDDDDQHNDDDDDDDDLGASALKALKIDLAGLVAGSYGEYCVKFIGDEAQQVGSGSTFTITPGGQASWGFGAIDMIATPSQDYGVALGGGIAGARFDLLDPVSQDRLAIIGVNVYDGGLTAATVTDDRQSPSLGDGCGITPPPALASADLWQLMNGYINIPTTRLHCVDSKAGTQLAWDFSFSSSEIVLGPLVTRAGDPRELEQVHLTEYEPMKGYVYSVVRPDEQTIIVGMTPDRKLESVVLTHPDATLVGCFLP